ncbi:MAG: peptidylprolyl isomerase [Clostridia bacterium]
MEELVKVNKKMEMTNDKKLILGIILVVVLITIGIFGYYFYATTLKNIVTFDGGKVNSGEYSVYYKTFAPMLEYYQYPAEVIPEQIANKAGVDKLLLIKAHDAKLELTADDNTKLDELLKDESQVKQFEQKGISKSKMKELFKNDLLVTAYINKMKNELSETEVKEYQKTTYGENIDMNEYATRHILFKITNPETGAPMDDAKKNEIKTKANDILAKAIAGEDFGKLATENSEDSGTKASGGEYKVYMDNNTAKEYETAVKTLTDGQVYASLVETEFGFHIIKLDTKKENGRLNSATDRETIVSKKIDEIGKTVNMKTNEKNMIKLVESITGKKFEKPNKNEEKPNENKNIEKPAEESTK